MTALKRLYQGKVAADEIDDLGHMNVRFYGERSLQATEALMAEHGLSDPACESIGASAEVFDIYTRHFREQLVDAPLAVMGGVLEATGYEIRAYHELLNTDTGDLAASFVHRIRLLDLETGSRLLFPELPRKSFSESIVAWPGRGRSRSIDLDLPLPPLSLAEARKRGMAHRAERFVAAEECDASGCVSAAQRQNLIWGGEPIPPHTGGPPMFDLEDGSRMSMAAMETRGLLVESPTAGTRIQSFSATVEIGNKTTIRRAWVFDLDREQVLFTSMFVDIALHLGKRRSIEIPQEVRVDLEARAQLDLR